MTGSCTICLPLTITRWSPDGAPQVAIVPPTSLSLCLLYQCLVSIKVSACVVFNLNLCDSRLNLTFSCFPEMRSWESHSAAKATVSLVSLELLKLLKLILSFGEPLTWLCWKLSGHANNFKHYVLYGFCCSSVPKLTIWKLGNSKSKCHTANSPNLWVYSARAVASAACVGRDAAVVLKVPRPGDIHTLGSPT